MKIETVLYKLVHIYYCTSAHILSYIILTYLIEMASRASYFLNTLRPGQNGRHFADNIFKCIFLNENVWIPIKISLKFFPKGPINNIPALVQIMAWRRQAIIWSNDGSITDAYMRHSASMS